MIRFLRGRRREVAPEVKDWKARMNGFGSDSTNWTHNTTNEFVHRIVDDVDLADFGSFSPLGSISIGSVPCSFAFCPRRSALTWHWNGVHHYIKSGMLDVESIVASWDKQLLVYLCIIFLRRCDPQSKYIIWIQEISLQGSRVVHQSILITSVWRYKPTLIFDSDCTYCKHFKTTIFQVASSHARSIMSIFRSRSITTLQNMFWVMAWG